jgi:hypothetical protein
MDIFEKMVERIIKGQEDLIGPIALEQAKKVEGLKVDWASHEITMTGNKKAVLEKLVKQYEGLFGAASVQVCKDAVKSMIGEAPKDQIPQALL